MERQLRLRRDADFARLRREGRAYHSRWMVLSVATNGLTHNRYGFVTSKQVGNAVQRNRVRRLLREAIRALHPALHSGYDIVLVARQSLAQEPYSAVLRIVGSQIQQAGLVMQDR
ncbi:MAG: ribonuclease P protein component [Anaerolineae bacterium]|nr:ribonuclease P protein component [Anaerolineae bacterium]